MLESLALSLSLSNIFVSSGYKVFEANTNYIKHIHLKYESFLIIVRDKKGCF